MTEWIENKGEKPSIKVDVKCNCDEPEWPGRDLVRYDQDPDDWDWQRQIGGIEITHYRPTVCKHHGRGYEFHS
jgi:hypothetical protein